MPIERLLFPVYLKVMGKAITDELLFVVSIAAVFLADDRCPKRLSMTSSLRWLKSLKTAMTFRVFRKVMICAGLTSSQACKQPAGQNNMTQCH